MARRIEFIHGVMRDSYELQANRQGFTLGDKKDCFDKMADSLIYCKIGGLITDEQYDYALNNLELKMVKCLRLYNGGVQS